jgi:iron(III) transport system permease protein
MTRWRLALVAVLLPAVAVPLAMPLVDFARGLGRPLGLAGNTLLLAAGAVALAVAAGVPLALLLYRTDLPGRRACRFLIVLSLFIPLPMVASAWQATLGAGGWLFLAGWGPAAGGGWAEGMVPAVWVQGLAGLPWVVVIAGQGFRWVEAELEEDALLAARAGRVVLVVTLPRARALIGAAALWVALQAVGDITVTDVFQVRTFAEEVYTQWNQGGAEGLAGAVAAGLPAALLAWLLVVWAVRRLGRSLPPLETLLRPARPFRLGGWRWPCLLGVLAVLGLTDAVPLASLVWKAGLAGAPPAWSFAFAGDQVATAMRVHGSQVAGSLFLAALAGAAAAALGLLVCWLTLETPRLQAVVVGLLAAAWALPGPVVGLGLKETILAVVEWLPVDSPVAAALYYGPSPLPVFWVDLVRFLPCAVAVLWPVVRLLPRELRDAARVDGARPALELRHLVWPLTARSCGAAALVVAALSLGERSAGKLVETPGSETFAQLVFDRLHYGVGPDLAALCLVLLAGVLAAAMLLSLTVWWLSTRKKGGPGPP